MNDNGQKHGLPVYVVRLSDAANANLDDIMLRLVGISPALADRWYHDLLDVLESLEQLPYRCTRVELPERPDAHARQILFGRGRMVYRVLFTILEPVEEGEQRQVLVFRILHGAQER